MSTPQLAKGKRKERLTTGNDGNSNKKRKVTNDTSTSDMKIAAKYDTFFSGKENQNDEVESEEDEFKDETVDEKRVRLAKMYLEKLATMEEKEDSEEDAKDDDKITTILQNQAFAERSGRSYRFLYVADKIAAVDIPADLKVHHGQQLAITSVAVAEDDSVFYSASKDGTIVKWDLKTIKKLHTFKPSRKKEKNAVGHIGPVYTISLSTDGTILASGGNDKKIKIWDTKTNNLIETFNGHRDKVSGVSFQVATHKLYSCSYDRSIKVWNCDTRAYVETLYGHTAAPHTLHSLRREHCLSGSYDKSVRLWKIPDQTQLVYSGGGIGGSIDSVFFITEELWITGSQDGTFALWNINKKKPIFIVKNAHGQSGIVPNWISSVAAIPFSDIIATGSYSGTIKLWKLVNSKELHFIKDIPLVGWINALQFSKSGKYLFVGVGKDPRFGRWGVVKEAKNGICVVPLLPEKAN